MAKKTNFNGKLGGNHTTIVDGARTFISEIAKEETITRISPGFIASGKKASAKPRVKITEEKGCLLLSLRTGCSVQEVRILTSQRSLSKAAISKIATDYGFKTSYLDKTQASA